jgi:hypothetical protein
MSKEKTVRKPLLGARPYGEAGAVNQFGPHYELPRAWSRHQSHWYCGPPPLVYKNLSVIQWSREDVQDNCKSCRAFDHNERFGSGEENAPIYLCREQPRYWRTYSGPPKGGLK